SLVQSLDVRVLPNTAGCHSVSEAVTTAQMAREVFGTDWIKLEVIGNSDTLQPDVFGLVEAARILASEGFEVFPYTTDDLIVAERLLDAGCKLLMPWCAPIGSARGPQNPEALRSLRGHFPDIPLIVDAGIGRPSHAAAVMELGYDAVLLNTAIAKAGDPVAMAAAFGKAIEAGRGAYCAGLLEPRDMAVPSTPVIGMAAFS
ncbi:MAG: thiazole synthase, partial [Mesorhizobium sp.]